MGDWKEELGERNAVWGILSISEKMLHHKKGHVRVQVCISDLLFTPALLLWLWEEKKKKKRQLSHYYFIHTRTQGSPVSVCLTLQVYRCAVVWVLKVHFEGLTCALIQFLHAASLIISRWICLCSFNQKAEQRQSVTEDTNRKQRLGNQMCVFACVSPHPCFAVSYSGCLLGPWLTHTYIYTQVAQLVCKPLTHPGLPVFTLSLVVFVFSSFSCAHNCKNVCLHEYCMLLYMCCFSCGASVTCSKPSFTAPCRTPQMFCLFCRHKPNMVLGCVAALLWFLCFAALWENSSLFLGPAASWVI